MNQLESAFWEFCKTIVSSGKRRTQWVLDVFRSNKDLKLDGFHPSIVKRWIEGSHSPRADHIFQFYDKIYSRAAFDRRKSEVIDEIKRDDIALCLTIGKTFEGETALCLAQIAADLGPRYRFVYGKGNSSIATQRNQIAEKFKRTGCKKSLWIDTDMIVPVGKVDLFRVMCRNQNIPEHIAGAHVLERFLSHNVDIVSALYMQRAPGGKPVCSQGMFNPKAADRLKQMSGDLEEEDQFVGFGCVMIDRDVFLAIDKKRPDLKTRHESMPYQYFKDGPDGATEDVTFSWLAREAGYKIYVDTGCVCGHIGDFAYAPWNT